MKDIEQKLMSLKGARIIGLRTDTEPRMRKTDNPYFGKIRKMSSLSVMVNFHYDDGVCRRLEKEGKSLDCFRQGESWHEPVIENNRLTPFCKHKKTGEKYLRAMYLNGSSRFVNLQGSQIDKEEIAPYLIESSNYANQGLDNPLLFLTYKLESIVEVTGV